MENRVFKSKNELTNEALEACQALLIDPNSLFPMYFF